MNNIFDFTRFRNYLSLEVKGGFKTYLLSCSGILAALMIFISLDLRSYEYGYTHDTYMDRDPMYYLMESLLYGGLFVIGCLAASLMFSNLSNKEGRISSLMLPVSHLEKYLVHWLIIPLSIISYLVIFELADLLRIGLVNTLYPGTPHCHPHGIGNIFVDNSELWSVLILMQALFALGSIIWPKKSLIKTALALFVICVVMFFYGMWLSDTFMDNSLMYRMEDMLGMLCWLIGIISVICYVIGYFRFKEIEILQRW